ncbi:MAG: DUF512 domain-containing protein [Lachnospiraceae bacterium]|nr:DUF512 domain-containing protein [Lachnospiraceae bacterium]
MTNDRSRKISQIIPGSPASDAGIRIGDELISINGLEIRDVFDYQYAACEEECSLVLKDEKGGLRSICIIKEEEEDLGLVFEEGLMDRYRSCCNKCIFCFIDQLPKGLRKTLYFKDDDSRLSFLQGNYVTLTNMSDEDIERIIRYNLSPVNISFQTTNPKLRVKMMGNRFAGEALKKAERLNEAGITMNGQIVLCRGINDGPELERSIRDLSAYIPNLQSLSVVPVGLSRYREGLFELQPFDEKDSAQVLDLIEKWQKKIYKEHGIHFVHASDEWYVKAARPIPAEDTYDGYPQLENGVGMLRLMEEEFRESIIGLHKSNIRREFSCVTGKITYPFIQEIVQSLAAYFPNVTAHVYCIENDFFGENITVTGLLTGKDIIGQLEGKPLGDRLYIPENVFRAGEEVMLDDVTIADLEQALQVKVDIVKSDGTSFVRMFEGRYGDRLS